MPAGALAEAVRRLVVAREAGAAFHSPAGVWVDVGICHTLDSVAVGKDVLRWCPLDTHGLSPCGSMGLVSLAFTRSDR